jgi:hypothetical protein
MTAALERSEWSAARPGRTLPPGKTRYALYRRLGGPPGGSGRAENLVPTGIRSRTVQPVVSRVYLTSTFYNITTDSQATRLDYSANVGETILFDECKFEIYFLNYGTILKNTKNLFWMLSKIKMFFDYG